MIAKEVESFSKHTVNIISNGIELDKFYPSSSHTEEDAGIRDKYLLKSHTPYILYVGRMSLEKKVHVVIQAFSRVMQETDTHLVLVGDGPKMKTMINLAKKLGVFDRTHFLGILKPGEELNSLYRSAAVFVMASEVEAQGLVILEAAASGLPVVAVRATCIPEVVTDGENGYLIEPGDIAGMADSLISIIKNGELAHSMGAAGRTLAESHSHENSLDNHEKLYQSLLAV
jgi:glycosyltransferase involved in cell wall biosynthesis